MPSPPKIVLKERRARPIWYGHPWVFSGAVDRVKGRPRDGDVVEVLDAGGVTIGCGFYNAQSQILVRMLQLGEGPPPDRALLRQRLERALALRRDLLRLPSETTAWRLVHGEADGLPGLVVDVLDAWLVVQVSCLGMERFLEGLLDDLQELLGPTGILERPAGGAAEEEGLTREPCLLRGVAPAGPVEVVEAGVSYLCDPEGGQKTGFYSDQRPNRLALAPLTRDADVLDAFSYVGGFGLRFAVAGARHVTCMDSSVPALAFAAAGAERNGVADRVTTVKANVLRQLDHFAQEKRTFDVAVMDPPKLVHRRKDLEKGLRLYEEINRKAVRVLRDGGLLITCSCSQHVSSDAFDDLLGEVAKSESVRLQEIHRGTQGPDHPVLLPHAESRYLKCRAYRVSSSG